MAGELRLDMFPSRIADLSHTGEMGRTVDGWARTIAGNTRALIEATNLGPSSPVSAGGTGEDHESVYGTVTNSDPGWHFHEYGTADVAASAPMRAGAEASGARVIDRGALS